ncbi:late competence development ComFB family protein [Halomicronema sp. CCY15110]|uniref:late competence development ComFB family protein n=1 Tax=Halomicronema sp. CCY15110 TaxID=2767773 RepID=UPI001950B635|nr:late competence development ComFB family protein [Halomicronema sp. CCY15110]
MELLVADEVDRQLQDLPSRLAKYLKRSEIETFALNRLPALYAASERGLDYQRAKAQKELPGQITQAVRQALAAVQGDPLRAAQPLQIDAPQQQAEAALALLQQWLEAPNLTWDKALAVLAQCQRQPTSHPQSVAQALVSPTPLPPTRRATAQGYAKEASELKSTALRPGVYGCRTTWIPKQRQAQSWQR